MTAGLPGEDEVVHPGDAEHGVVDTVAFEAAVAEDLPGLQAGENVLLEVVFTCIGGLSLVSQSAGSRCP
ncbi:hypothetical protein GCM10010282_04060 [Streptomyces roseolus]|nr:hypothetical protein GCM10010282_04060 [Streptomyces roseolus]